MAFPTKMKTGAMKPEKAAPKATPKGVPSPKLKKPPFAKTLGKQLADAY